MALETSAEAPVPVRTVLQAVGGWIGKLGRIWVEGQIAECTKRGNTVFLTLRDPIADPLICRPAGYRARPKSELSCETHSRLPDINIEFEIEV